MRQFNITFAALAGWWLLTAAVCAQETNVLPPQPPTRLQAMETNTGTIIIKGYALIGSVSAKTAVISVRCKEDTDIGAGRKEYGISVGIKVGEWPENRTIIDYDELDSLLNALDYLGRINWSVTSLTGFEAVYTTKAGLQIAAFSSRRAGTIEFAIRGNSADKLGVMLELNQLSQLRELVDQARRKLDSIRESK